MSLFNYFLAVFFLAAERSFANLLSSPVEEKAPSVVGASEPATHVVPASISTLASHYAPIYPYPMYSPYYHPHTELLNVAKSYAKETGRSSAISVISQDGHPPASLGLHPTDHVSRAHVQPVPVRSLLHRKKKARKASRAHKSLNKKD